MRARIENFPARLVAPLAIAAGAVVLWVAAGVGFANYDTLYALAWGGQLARGETPQYGIPIAPTPHPLVEVLGVVLSPLSPGAIEGVTVALGFLALSACGWVLYRLGSLWFGRAAGALAALILLTRVPVLSYGVRAYVDIPYLLLVLCALLVEARHRRAGAPVLALLALAGLLRPEAWVFSGLYWLYLMGLTPRWAYSSVRDRSLHTRQVAGSKLRTRGAVVRLTLLAAAAPLVWVASDWLVTGPSAVVVDEHAAHRRNARSHHRDRERARVHPAADRRDPQPAGARRRGARRGDVAVAFAAAGSSRCGCRGYRGARVRGLRDSRAADQHALRVPGRGDPLRLLRRRRVRLDASPARGPAPALVDGWRRARARGLLAYIPTQYRTVHKELTKLARQETFQNELVALVEDGSITRRCEPVGVPNHAPIPLLALYLGTSPRKIVSAEAGPIAHGSYVDPASKEVEDDYVLDPHDPHLPVEVPPGFTEAHANSAWFIFEHCP